MSTWRKLLEKEMKNQKESFGDIIATSIPDEMLDKTFTPAFGLNGPPGFTAWTKKKVYFTRYYDGLAYLDSTNRNPEG